VLRNRIRLKISAGAYGPALKLLDQYLVKNPDDRPAKAQREQALRRIRELHEATQGGKP